MYAEKLNALQSGGSNWKKYNNADVLNAVSRLPFLAEVPLGARSCSLGVDEVPRSVGPKLETRLCSSLQNSVWLGMGAPLSSSPKPKSIFLRIIFAWLLKEKALRNWVHLKKAARGTS